MRAVEVVVEFGVEEEAKQGVDRGGEVFGGTACGSLLRGLSRLPREARLWQLLRL